MFVVIVGSGKDTFFAGHNLLLTPRLKYAQKYFSRLDAEARYDKLKQVYKDHPHLSLRIGKITDDGLKV